MNSIAVLGTLNACISELNENSQLYSASPGTDFTRKRKLPFEKVVSAVLAFRSGTLNHEMMDFFGMTPC